MRTFALLLLAMVATCAALKCNTYDTRSGAYGPVSCGGTPSSSAIECTCGAGEQCRNTGYVWTILGTSTGYSEGGCKSTATTCDQQKAAHSILVTADDWSCTTCATDGCNAVVVSGSAREASVTFAVAVLAFAALKIQ